LTTYPHRISRRKIYDLVLVDTELDWLEIRMHELQHQVDYFVILEATSTFTQHPKPLHFKSNFDRFQDFYPKIIYHALNLDHIKDGDAWEREIYSRNSLFDVAFPSLLGPAAPELGDVILVSDADEIPRPSALILLRNCQFPERTTLRSRFFYYSFQWLHVGLVWDYPKEQEWHHPQATYYQGLNETIKPEDLRMSHNGDPWDLWNAGWHCSSCFSTVAQMIHKIESFSHTDWDQPQFKEPSEIVRRVRHGVDIVDREWENNLRVDPMKDIPEYLKKNQERFDYMLNRDPMNANFKDYG
jgi:beta-1,4-mannosyl-glycoprotein beta-1,4-N-acetylglucosaminyltransferase